MAKGKRMDEYSGQKCVLDACDTGKDSKRMKILLVEDDTEISEMLKNFLMTENFEVVTAYDGESACEKFFADEYSIVLLDLMIPKMNGMEVMKTIRASSTVPIIILSAKDTDSDKTLGLGLGADDYVTKPFSVTEVLARIKANIRRSTQYTSPVSAEEGTLTKGDLVLDLNAYSVMKNGQKVELTAKEFEILNPQFIADSPDSGNILRVAGIVLNLVAQPADVDIDRIFISHIGVIPNLGIELPFCVDFLRILHQKL